MFKKKPRRSALDVGIKSFTKDDDRAIEQTPSHPSSRQSSGEEEDDDAERRGAGRSEEVNLEDLVALRALRKKTHGIDLDRLNRGEIKAKKKAKQPGEKGKGKRIETEEEKWAEQMQKGGLVASKEIARLHAAEEVSEEEEEDDQGAGDKGVPRLVRQDNFQGETGTVDVDKHMMAYIEEEMQKRRQGLSADADVIAAVDGQRPGMPTAAADDELFRIAEKYREIQQTAKEALSNGGERMREKEDGNVTLSTAMLTSVPEIDLGMDVRMRNIEATERARKAMEAQRQASADRRSWPNAAQALDDEAADTFVAATRFQRRTHSARSDSPFSSAVGRHDVGVSEFTEPMAQSSFRTNSYKRQPTATDDAALERFKKRQRNQLKR